VAFDLPSAAKAFEIARIEQPPTLSPGGKWCAAPTAEGVAWHSTADGSFAGLSPLPAEWFEVDPNRRHTLRQEPKGDRPTRVFIHPNGTTAAALTLNPHYDLHVAVWDLASGKVTDALALPYAVTQQSVALEAVFPNERRLLLSCGFLVDFDFKAIVMRYQLDWWHGPGPDGRFWRLAGLKPEETEQLISKLGDTQQADELRKRNFVLAATTVPDPALAEQLAQARQGFAWHPGMDVRLEISGNVNEEQTPPTVEALAADVAQRGFRIRPDAKYAVRLNVDVHDGLVVKQSWPLNHMMNLVEFEMGKEGNMRISVVDDQGEPMFATHGSVAAERRFVAGGADAIQQALRKRLWEIELPTLYFRDAAGKRLPLALLAQSKIRVGIDGLLDPPAAESAATDEYELPKDGE
jgi:hypothetical protein